MGMDKLMLFRTIYLRSVAEAWANKDFHKKLIHDPVSAMREFFGFEWPWPHVCELRVEETTQFEWIGDDWVWTPCQGESLTLRVPLEPRGIEPSQRAMALADFYRQRSSIFTDDWDTQYGPDGPKHPEAKHGESVSTGFGGELGPGSGPPAGGYVPGPEVFANFKVVLLAAIARAWEDSKFRRKLELDTATGLHAIREYELPWKLLIRVVDDVGAKWNPPGDQTKHPRKHQSFWSHDKKNVLRLLLPSQPDEPACEPLALASYNATGAQFPFTCCCFE
jgi:ribosomally synthesized peptide (two-chain TOMM family)